MTRFRQLSWRSITWIQAALIADGLDWERWTLRRDSFSLTSVVGEAGISPATTWRYRVVVLRLNEDESQAGALLREADPCSLRSANPHGSRSLGCAPIASAPDRAGLMQGYLAVRSARHRYLWIGGPAGTRHLQNKNASIRIRRQSLVPIVAWIPGLSAGTGHQMANMKTCGGSLLGLWGTANPNRVVVTIDPEDAESIIGFVREVDELQWTVEGDKDGYIFRTPREAAEYGYQAIWKIVVLTRGTSSVNRTSLPGNRQKGLNSPGTL